MPRLFACRRVPFAGPSRVLIRYAAAVGCCCLLGGIAPSAGGIDQAVEARQPARPGKDGGGDRPAAVLGGQAIGWPEIAPLLAEAVGAAVMEEVILERALERECADRGLAVGAPETEAEHRLLAASLAEAARLPNSEGETLVREVRVARGLGEKRFASLLRRNAMLRALANRQTGPDAVLVTEEDITQAHQLRYGPRIKARLILVRTSAEAAAVVRRLGEGEAFAEVAAQASADPSRLRGGLLDPISPADPGYPVAFRRALEQTAPGELSPPVMVTWDSQPGFAIVRVDERLPGEAVDLASVHDKLAAEVRAVRERAAMDRLARRLIEEQAARLSVLDASLEWSWRTRRARSQ